MSSQMGEPIVINLEEARKRLEKEPAGTKALSDDTKERALRCASGIDKVLKEERCQLLVNPQLHSIGSGIFKVSGALVIKAI